MKHSKTLNLLVLLTFANANQVLENNEDVHYKVKLQHCSQPKHQKESFCEGFVLPVTKKTETKNQTADKMSPEQIEAEAKQKAAAKAAAEAQLVKEAQAKQLAEELAAQQAADAKKIIEAQAAHAAAELAAQLAATQAAEAAAALAESEAKKKAEDSAVVVEPVTAEPISKVYSGPDRKTIKTEAENKALFERFCEWNGDISVSPIPVYSEKTVDRAAKILTRVSELNEKDFYFYSTTKKFYREAVEKGPSEYSKEARTFLTHTCGEFRDRAEMIQAKINWVNNIFLLADEEPKTGEAIDYSTNIWSQLSAKSYNDYLIFADSLFSARAAQARANDYLLKKALGQDAEAAVSPNTVCETKYMIGKYVSEKIPFNSLAEFERGYLAFERDPRQCSEEDKNYYYNFRGDANFKEYSGESNAMIWHALSIGRFCSSNTTANGKNPKITNETCSAYLQKPFLTRYNAARSGLAAWLLYPAQDEHKFADQGARTTIRPNFDDTVGKQPFEMKLSDGSVMKSSAKLEDSTLGFNQIFNLGTDAKANLPGAFDRLKHAVNRHTNWYKSEYHNESSEDLLPLDAQGKRRNDFKNQAYSPFVASSYEMSKSNQFAECGYTIECPNPDNRKAWMFIFKIKKDNWYNTHSLAANKAINFDKAWLDETTFGTDHLAQIERAFDRLGTPLEEEFDSILYLRNLETGGHGTKYPNGAKPVANDALL